MVPALALDLTEYPEHLAAIRPVQCRLRTHPCRLLLTLAQNAQTRAEHTDKHLRSSTPPGTRMLTRKQEATETSTCR